MSEKCEHDEAVQALAVGADFGLYTVRSVLGRGSFGVAYLGHDKQLNRPVLIKEHAPGELCRRVMETGEIVPKRGCSKLYAQSLREFLQEMETQAALRAPGVPEVYEIFDAGGTAYGVLRYVEGEPLHRWVRAGAERRRLLPLLLGEVLRVLMPLHKRGVLHRDLKPGHIVVGAAGEVHLIDFGAASSPTRPPLPAATPPYAPPEQGLPEMEGAWTDLYALGAVFYEVTCGCKPPSAAERLDSDAAPDALGDDAALAAELPYAYLASIDRALELDPRRRFDAAEQWLDALAPPRLPQVRSRRRRWLWWAAAAAVVAAAAAAVAVWGAMGQGGHREDTAREAAVAEEAELPQPMVVEYALPQGVFDGSGGFCPAWEGVCVRIELVGAVAPDEAWLAPVFAAAYRRSPAELQKAIDMLVLVLLDAQGREIMRSLPHGYDAATRTLSFTLPEPLSALPQGWQAALVHRMEPGDQRRATPPLRAERLVIRSMVPRELPPELSAGLSAWLPIVRCPMGRMLQLPADAVLEPADEAALRALAMAGYPYAAAILAAHSADPASAARWQKIAAQWGLKPPPRRSAD